MKHVKGTLEAYGPSVEKDGGMRYSFIRIKQDDGRIVNISDHIAFKEVESQLTYVLAQENREIALHYKPLVKKIYAIEYDGHVYSDAKQFKKTWAVSLAIGIALPVILLLFFSGGKEGAKYAVLSGLFFVPLSIFAWFEAIRYWPSKAARQLDQKVAQRQLAAS
ncbi:hypothetical protein P7L87_24475 [Vibrio parahaemolyticus]|nr:hypothetical protein [Vibrio parahaemolyticus]